MSRRRGGLEPVPNDIRERAQGPPRPRGILLSDVEDEDVRWLWEGRIPLGKITVLDGDPGLGKSAFTTDLAARVSVGRDFPDGTECPTGGVVLLNAEDGLADTIKPRFDAAGGDGTKVIALAEIPDDANPKQDRVLSLPEDIPVIEDGIRRVGAKLVIIDPLMAFLGGDTNAHKDQDIRRALASLKSMAERTGVAVLLVRHLNKGQSGNPLYRGGGSIGIIGAARSGLLVASDPNDPEEKRRVLAGSKNNLAEMAGSVLFQVVTAANGAARVEWLGESEIGARDLVKTPLDEEEKSAMDEAVEFLREELSGGPMSAKTIEKSAKDASIAPRTLQRAKAHLRIRSRREMDGYWTWNMPDLTKPAEPTLVPSEESSEDVVRQTSSPGDVGDVGNLANGDVKNPPYLSEEFQVRQVRQDVNNKELQARASKCIHEVEGGCALCVKYDPERWRK